jgi:hypothetical protein
VVTANACAPPSRAAVIQRYLKAIVVGVVAIVVLALGMFVGTGPLMWPFVGEVVVGGFTLLWPWGIFVAWVSLQEPGSIRHRYGIVALTLTAVGAWTLGHHVDEPPSLLCTLEWVGLPGWPLSNWVLAHRTALHMSEELAAVVTAALIYASPLIWVAILVSFHRCRGLIVRR